MDHRVLKKLYKIRDQVIQDYSEGTTIKDLAEFYKCSTSTVWSFLKENNVPLRKRGPKPKEK